MAIAPQRLTATSGLLEREDALAALRGAHSETRAGTGRLVLVSGEAGIGKTSLVRAFAASLGPSTRVLEGHCDALFTPRPLSPFADVARETNGALHDIVERRGGAHEVFDALREELEGGETVLILEDLHWADEATLDVIRMLGRRVDAMRVLVILTYRDDELDRAHPLRQVLGEIGPRAEEISLEPLSASAVAELASGLAIDPAELHRRTSGNPFFVRQVVEGRGEVVPPTARAAVLARLATLGSEARALVDAVSLAPPEVEAWLLERVCGDAIEQLDEALSVGVLMSRSESVSFRHELAREAVVETLGPARRLELHRRLLDALAEPPVGTPDVARLAHHAEPALDREAVLRWAPAAAKEAAAAGAYREAAAQYARALRFAKDRPPDERAELLEGRSRACYLADDQVEAIAVIHQAIVYRREAGSRAAEARDLSELTDYLLCRGLYTQAEEAVAEAARLMTDEPEAAATASVLVSRAALLYDSDIAASVDLCRKAQELAVAYGDPTTAAVARVTIGSLEMRRDPALGRRLLEEAALDCRERGPREQAARALNNLGGLGVASYDHGLANEFLPAALEYCTEHNLDLWRINVLALLARSYLDQGRWTEAADAASLLLDDPRESPWPHYEALVVLALIRTRRGDPGARDALDAAADVGVSPEETGAVVDLAAARAELAWLARKPEEVDRQTSAELERALARSSTGDVARLSYWRRLAGLETAVPEVDVGPVRARSGR